MKKRLWCGACILVLLSALLSVNVWAAADASGICGKNVRWSFDSSTGRLSINGAGAMYDYESAYDENPVPWQKFADQITSLSISDGITYIGADTFQDLAKAPSDVVIPDSVTEIGKEAFVECGFTGKLILGQRLQKIDRDAFALSGFTGDLVIPDSVVSIGEFAFTKCTGFTGTLMLGTGLRTLGRHCFQDCRFTGELVIPEGVTEIPEWAFAGDWLRSETKMFTGSLVLPSTLKTIGESAFEATALTGELRIPDAVTVIEKQAFYHSDGFGGTLILPDSVMSVGESAFYGCDGLTGLRLSKRLTRVEAHSFTSTGISGNLEIPDGVTEIGDGAFQFTNISRLILPQTLKSIGQEAFAWCRNLKTCPRFPNGLEIIGDRAFQFDYFKTAVVLPASLQSLGKEVFSRSYSEQETGVYFLGAPPRFFGTLNANCTFPKEWTLYYLPGALGWTEETYAGYQTAMWDGENRWDNTYTEEIGWKTGLYWTANTETGKLWVTGDFSDGKYVVAAMYRDDGRMTGVGLLHAERDTVQMDRGRNCRLLLLGADHHPLTMPVEVSGILERARR